jgi:hypothetical protein
MIWLCALLLHFAPSSALASYETVNGAPQFSADADGFSFYWALWRPSPSPGAALVTRREIRWTARDCATGAPVNDDGETYWFLDMGTIPQAPREGYSYLVLGNIQGGQLRGLAPYVRPARQAGESSEAFRARTLKLLQDWKRRASLQGSRGVIRFRTEARSLPAALSSARDQFRATDGPDFSRLEDPRHAPDRWPVYFDERAHKAHAAAEPAIWPSLAPDSDPLMPFEFDLEWNGCAAGQAIAGTVVIASPLKLPPGGPDRPGRSEGADHPAEIRFGARPN